MNGPTLFVKTTKRTETKQPWWWVIAFEWEYVDLCVCKAFPSVWDIWLTFPFMNPLHKASVYDASVMYEGGSPWKNVTEQQLLQSDWSVDRSFWPLKSVIEITSESVMQWKIMGNAAWKWCYLSALHVSHMTASSSGWMHIVFFFFFCSALQNKTQCCEPTQMRPNQISRQPVLCAMCLCSSLCWQNFYNKVWQLLWRFVGSLWRLIWASIFLVASGKSHSWHDVSLHTATTWNWG